MHQTFSQRSVGMTSEAETTFSETKCISRYMSLLIFTPILFLTAMADAATRGLAVFASVLKRSRLKPEIYNTVDGKIIVEDEFLNFLAVKIKTLSQDEIVLLAAKTFNSDWIEASKKVLFELCPTTQRNVSHKGPQKDVIT